MKKLISFITSTLLICSLSACASKEPSTTEKNDTSQNDVVQIGIMQIAEHPSLDEIRNAITAELEASADFEYEVDYQNAQNDFTALNSISQKFVGDKKDIIIAIATPTAQAASAATSDIPVVFSAVTDPISAGLELPNVTGTSDSIPVEEIFGLMDKLTPSVKTVGLIYNSGELNSISVIEQAKKCAELKGLSVVEATITNSSELAQASESLVGKVDCIFTPIDNTVAEAMPVLSDVARKNKIPVYTGADSLVKDGGFATVGINYTNLGAETAKIVIDIANGTAPSEIAYKTLDNYDIVINSTTADAIGISIPEEIASSAIIVD